MTIDPILICAECRRPKLHLFVERRPAPREPGELLYVDCIYECDTCRKERAWGSEPREEIVYGRRLVLEELAHAVDQHGMCRVRCPTCGGGDLDCRRCDDDGQAWVFEKSEPCGPACSLAGFWSLVDE